MSYFGSYDRFLDDSRYKNNNDHSKNKTIEEIIKKCSNEDCGYYSTKSKNNCLHFINVDSCKRK